MMVFHSETAGKGDALQDRHWTRGVQFKYPFAPLALKVMMMPSPQRFITSAFPGEVNGDNLARLLEPFQIPVDRGEPQPRMASARFHKNFSRGQGTGGVGERLQNGAALDGLAFHPFQSSRFQFRENVFLICSQPIRFHPVRPGRPLCFPVCLPLSPIRLPAA